MAASILAGACAGPPGDAGDRFEWQQALADLDEAVLSVCGSGDTVYAVGGDEGDALVLEWTGDAWRTPALPGEAGTLWWCWVGDDGETVAVGERATVLRRSAGAWHLEDTGDAIDPRHTLYGVWGFGGQIVVVGGSLGAPDDAMTIAHFDGDGWRAAAVGSLPDQPLFKVWGSAPDQLWAVGGGGTILRYDGRAWVSVPSPSEDRLIAVWGTGPEDVFAVGGDATGIVLGYDGRSWSRLDTTPERLSGVWTAAGRPLYVGGDRGFVARYPRADGSIVASRGRQTLAPGGLCIHALHGGEDRVAAAASDLVGGSAGRWRGAVLTHGAQLGGTLVREPPIDGGPAPDAGARDAGPGTDAALPGPGEECGAAPELCEPGLECWQLVDSGVFICTEPCPDAAACSAYGPDACCRRPGFQTLETVCIPASYDECAPS